MNTFDSVSDIYPDGRYSEMSSIAGYNKADMLKGIVPGRSYDCLLEKIAQVAEETYKTTLSPFTVLLDNNKMIAARYNTEEKDDSWKVEPNNLTDEELQEELHILERKLQNIQYENKLLENENDALTAKIDYIKTDNKFLKENIENPQ